jgi:Transcriptional regulators of sugar metabolism
LINQADELIVLADSSKFAKKGEQILCSLSRVNCVITDTDVADADVQWMERAGIRVIMVEPDAMSLQHALHYPDHPLPNLRMSCS